MSVKTSVHNYNKSLSLFKKIRELWDNLEGASDYQYMEALDKVDELQKHLSRIDLMDIRDYLKEQGKSDKFESIKHNLKVFKEGAYRIGKEILGWSYYNDLVDSLPRFVSLLKDKFPLKYSEEKPELVKKLAGALTHPDNVDRYKNNIEAILRGTMTLPYFARIADAVMTDPKTSRARAGVAKPVQHPRPPEMYTGQSKKEWEETQKKQRNDWEKMRDAKEESVDLTREKPTEVKKGNKNYIVTPAGEKLQFDFETTTPDNVVTYYMDKKEVYSYLSESFMTLVKYKKIFSI